MKTFNLKENILNEIKKDKMRYKVAHIIVLNGPVSFMAIGTERKSIDFEIKSVLKVHKMNEEFC